MTTNEATSSEKTEIKSAALAEGQKLAGCYLLKVRVGAPDGGELWQANDEVLGRDISLQFIPDKVRGDAKAVGDVRQEIKRNRQLIHPNILRVYDFVEEPDWAAVSMDAFEGESLASVIGKRSSRIFSVGEIQPWALQLCQTLEDAHKIGLFHRDISPANIYFKPDGSLFLAGFGFSRCVSDALRRLDGNQNAVSANLSPQLLEGQAAARTDDIYACGALFFELLTGQAPFSGADISDQIRTAAPKPMAELRPKDLEPIPESWEKTIAACLSKNPAERPPNAKKLAEQLTGASGSEASPSASAAPAAMAAAAAAVSVAAATGVKDAAPEKKEENQPKVPVPNPEASLETPAPAPAPTTRAKRTISTTGDASALSPAPAPKQSPEKTPHSESSAPSKITRPKTIKPDPYANIYANRSRFPTAGFVILVVALLAAGLLGYHFYGPHEANSPELPPDSTPAAQRGDTTASQADHAPGADLSGGGEKTPAANGNPSVETPSIATNGNASKTASTPAAAQNLKPDSSKTPAEVALDQKQADLDKEKKAVESAEKSVADLTKQQQTAEADAAAAQKALDDKSKSLPQAKKAVEELLGKKKKLEDDQKAADAAALQAKQAADEKQRLADTARQAVDDFGAKNKEKLAAMDAADTQLAEMKKTLADKQQAAAAAAKARTDAEAERAKEADAVKADELQVAQARESMENAQKAGEARKQEMRKLDEEAQALKKAMEDRMREIEEKRKKLESGTLPAGDSSGSGASTPALSTPPPAAGPSRGNEKPTAVKSGVALISPATAPLSTPKIDLNPLPKTAVSDPGSLANLPEPKIAPGSSAAETPAVPEKGANSLGQKFVPVGDVQFCIWQTRVKDFEAFAKAVNLKSVGWRSPGFKQGPDHPVVNVTWQEAVAFCAWLTEKEHKQGVLPKNQYYRLPTDLEWSKAVGLPDEPEKTPAERDMQITDVYPWGRDWPPPPGAGNYTGEETGSDVAIKGYNDGFAWTSPVGSFKPNKYGIYDMGGNVWQWCMDSWNEKSTGKVLRGASWYNGALKLSLLSSCRVHAAPESSTDNYGFRIVKAAEGARAAKR